MQWRADAQAWLEVMKMFLKHGAGLNASSKAHWSQPRPMKPLAILEKFPNPLVYAAKEVKEMIEISSPKKAMPMTCSPSTIVN